MHARSARALIPLIRPMLVALAICASIIAQDIAAGAKVKLVTRANDIPGHPAVGDNSVSERLASGSTVSVAEVSIAKPHWIHVKKDAAHAGTWIITKYVDSVVQAAGTPTTTAGAYVIGCWNLEHFGLTKSRGFPENTFGGPTYPARVDSDYEDTATVITQHIDAKLLVLSEINGFDCSDHDSEPCTKSKELDKLLGFLGGTWAYEIGRTGGSQRVAILYDQTCCRLNEVIEIEVPLIKVDGKDIFSRDPLAAHVTLLSGGQAMNDLVVVGLHLASGQHRDDNHDRAMDVLQAKLESFQAQGFLGGNGEADIVLMGDLNANMFEPPAEQFFLDMDDEAGRWDVLAGNDYPVTRMSGNPLGLHKSTIDYIIVTRAKAGFAGLSGAEITMPQAVVHEALIPAFGGATSFRRRLSDHLPVTVNVAVTADTDS